METVRVDRSKPSMWDHILDAKDIAFSHLWHKAIMVQHSSLRWLYLTENAPSWAMAQLYWVFIKNILTVVASAQFHLGSRAQSPQRVLFHPTFLKVKDYFLLVLLFLRSAQYVEVGTSSLFFIKT